MPDTNEHPVTNTLFGYGAKPVISYAGAMERSNVSRAGLSVTPILTTSAEAYLKDSQNLTVAAKEDGDMETSSFFEDEDEETLARNMVTRSMVEKTIKHLDAYSKILNAKYGQESNEDLYKEIMEIARLTNQWLEVTGEKDESDYYDI
jgi:hypothetical protein